MSKNHKNCRKTVKISKNRQKTVKNVEKQSKKPLKMSKKRHKTVKKVDKNLKPTKK